jgi:hypothetical protein
VVQLVLSRADSKRACCVRLGRRFVRDSIVDAATACRVWFLAWFWFVRKHLIKRQFVNRFKSFKWKQPADEMSLAK